MNLKNITIGKRIILTFLSIISIANFCLLTYSLVYAAPESVYKKYAFIIGLLFIVVTRTTWSFYKTSIHYTAKL